MLIARHRTALVTGGGVGIGRAIALALVDSGINVTVTYRSHKPDAELIAHTDRAVQVDATDEHAMRTLAETLAPDGLDVLVNNVGGLVDRSLIESMSYQLWRDVLTTNLDTMFIATHTMLPLLRDGGRIINIASLAGRNGGHPGATAYATTKAGVFGFTRGLAKELARRRITVNAVAPGFIEDTPFHSTFTTDASKKDTISTIPLGRAGVPTDVASACRWLADEDAGFVSGAIIDVNGAQYFG